jgi:phosphoglycolate phosphatase-like HAD superfamily hydrolase
MTSTRVPEPCPLKTPSRFLVVFDKDGTLVDFDAMWSKWAEDHAREIEARLVRPHSSLGEEDGVCASFRRAYYSALDYNCATRTVGGNGVLACSPMALVYRTAADIAASWCTEPTERTEVEAAVAVAAAIAEPNPEAAVPRGNLVELFEMIVRMGAAIAVCTTDNRAVTEATMAHLGLTKYICAMCCGDDGGVAHKPDRAQIDLLRTASGAGADCTVMVGDTPTDMQLGRNAACALSVGILGGASSLDDLAQHADCLIPSLDRLPKLLRLAFAAAAHGGGGADAPGASEPRQE